MNKKDFSQPVGIAVTKLSRSDEKPWEFIVVVCDDGSCWALEQDGWNPLHPIPGSYEATCR